MKMQSDLFGDAMGLPEVEEPEVEPAAVVAEPLAMPCGFLNRANQRCRGLAHRPVMLEGVQMVCRGRPMLHCDPECFMSAQPPAPVIDEDDWP